MREEAFTRLLKVKILTFEKVVDVPLGWGRWVRISLIDCTQFSYFFSCAGFNGLQLRFSFVTGQVSTELIRARIAHQAEFVAIAKFLGFANQTQWLDAAL